MTLPYLTHFLDSFADIVRLAAGRLKPPNLYLAVVQKMGVTSWLHQLLAEQESPNQRTLSHELGVDRTRVQQFLYLFRIPDDLRVRIRGMEGVTEGQLRPLTQMDPMATRAAIEVQFSLRIMNRRAGRVYFIKLSLECRDARLLRRNQRLRSPRLINLPCSFLWERCWI
jgi:hypothetical protein